jgi:hypothetical protein
LISGFITIKGGTAGVKQLMQQSVVIVFLPLKVCWHIFASRDKSVSDSADLRHLISRVSRISNAFYKKYDREVSTVDFDHAFSQVGGSPHPHACIIFDDLTSYRKIACKYILDGLSKPVCL